MLSLWLPSMGNRHSLPKWLILLLFLLKLSYAVQQNGATNDGACTTDIPLITRPHSVSILEFGAVGDGKTLNTVAFQNAIFYLKSFTDKGGAQLYVPAGRWLTGSIDLTSHLTLFLEKDAIILGTQDYVNWDVVKPLPSYGRGIEVPGGRYRSLITGSNLTDVVITGDNGTIDGQGSIWWDQFASHSLNYSRPHLVEFINASNIVISNITFLNPPAWSIHPVYCRNVLVQNVTAYSPAESPRTSGVVPDSSERVCVKNCNISMGHDAIVLKSGWDQYGIAYGRPTTDVHIREVRLQSSMGSALAFGSEMSGGISNARVEFVRLHDSFIGFNLKTARGRGGYMKDILFSYVDMKNVEQALKATGQCDSHPDDQYDHDALPDVNCVSFKNIVGTNITTAGNFSGISDSPFTSISLSNITFHITAHSSLPWICSNVFGSSENVSPEPCPDLNSSISNSSACLLSYPNNNHFANL